MTLGEEFAEVDPHTFETGRAAGALLPLLEDDRYGEVWVVEDHTGLLGYAVLVWGYSVESGGRDALLDEIYMREPGTGDGSRLLERVVSSARDREIPVIFLETEPGNEAARRFYLRHGFVVEGSIWMTLDLD